MGLIIDTSVIIEAEKGIIDFSTWQEYETVYISPITITELLIGVDRANSEARRIRRSAFVEHTINSIAVLPFGMEEARLYAQIIHNLYKENLSIAVHDMLIASSSIATGYPILTLNIKDFARIKGVAVLDANNLKEDKKFERSGK